MAITSNAAKSLFAGLSFDMDNDMPTFEPVPSGFYRVQILPNSAKPKFPKPGVDGMPSVQVSLLVLDGITVDESNAKGRRIVDFWNLGDKTLPFIGQRIVWAHGNRDLLDNAPSDYNALAKFLAENIADEDSKHTLIVEYGYNPKSKMKTKRAQVLNYYGDFPERENENGDVIPATWDKVKDAVATGKKQFPASVPSGDAASPDTSDLPF